MTNVIQTRNETNRPCCIDSSGMHYFAVRALDINVSKTVILAFLTFHHKQVLLNIRKSLKNLESFRYILLK